MNGIENGWQMPLFETSEAKKEMSSAASGMKQQAGVVRNQVYRAGCVALGGGAFCSLIHPALGIGWFSLFGFLGGTKVYAAKRMLSCVDSYRANKEQLFNLQQMQQGILKQIDLVQKAPKKEVGQTIQGIKKQWSQAKSFISSMDSNQNKESIQNLLSCRQSILHLSKHNPSLVKEKLAQLLASCVNAEGSLSALIRKEQELGEEIQEKFTYWHGV